MTVTDTDFLQEVIEGFSLEQKSLHPKWLYDHRGSEIFEDITDVPEYYPTRTEAKIFQTAFPDLATRAPDISTVIEYGSGASHKADKLISALGAKTYVPIDIADTFLLAAAEDARQRMPSVEVVPVVADFTQAIALPDIIGPTAERLGFFPGSTIGNFKPGTAAPFLSRVRDSLGEGARFLISGDLVKPKEILEGAYDDAGGVTAEFNLNLLHRMNRELDADFDVHGFSHRAIFNEEKSRIEMHLLSLTDQVVSIGGQTFSFSEGETIHTENSYKYTVDGFEEMANEAGWQLETCWTDDQDLFAVFLLRN